MSIKTTARQQSRKTQISNENSLGEAEKVASDNFN